MSLADLVTQNEVVTIKVKNKKVDVEVYPLTIGDIGLLLKDYGTQVESLFAGTTSTAALLQKAPELVAGIIAYGTRNPEEIEHAKQLSFGNQVKILKAIWALTEVEPEELGNMASHLLEGILQVAGAINTSKLAMAAEKS
ncbi:MAG: hypothetical protein GQ570_03890 [Helicobacteraceae bacterium]|nr:hypothetical protein [Helicobacteraceae bacterium]